MTHLVQIQKDDTRRVALVEEPHLRVLDHFPTVHALAFAAVARRRPLAALARESAGQEILLYDQIYQGHSEWSLLTPIDHPVDPARCLVSGTGLTHLGSARNRSAMHSAATGPESDSMKMFRWGVEGGRPAEGHIGIAPEWFFKGRGGVLRAHHQALEIPAFAEDGGEEAEIAGVYLIDADGHPCRLGFTPGNEFSDHAFEKKNYLNLAGSKIRTCSIGPELILDSPFESVPGRTAILRAGQEIWSKDILTGQAEMCHSLANIEHHHFKFPEHRRPGDVHVHYFGACALSFGDGVRLLDGDLMQVEFQGFGRALRNPVATARDENSLVRVHTLS